MFPGEKSPGLIEAQYRHLSSLGQMFPGEKSPGLIEASLMLSCQTVPLDVSGGEIPRPH